MTDPRPFPDDDGGFDLEPVYRRLVELSKVFQTQAVEFDDTGWHQEATQLRLASVKMACAADSLVSGVGLVDSAYQVINNLSPAELESYLAGFQ